MAEDRLKALEEQMGTVISALGIITAQKANSDLSAENQALRQALAISTNELQKNVASATLKLDSYQQTTNQQIESIKQALSRLQISDQQMTEAVRKEVGSLMPKLNAEIEIARNRLNEIAEFSTLKMQGATKAMVVDFNKSGVELKNIVNASIAQIESASRGFWTTKKLVIYAVIISMLILIGGIMGGQIAISSLRGH